MRFFRVPNPELFHAARHWRPGFQLALSPPHGTPYLVIDAIVALPLEEAEAEAGLGIEPPASETEGWGPAFRRWSESLPVAKGLHLAPLEISEVISLDVPRDFVSHTLPLVRQAAYAAAVVWTRAIPQLSGS